PSPTSTLFPYTTLFRSVLRPGVVDLVVPGAIERIFDEDINADVGALQLGKAHVVSADRQGVDGFSVSTEQAEGVAFARVEHAAALQLFIERQRIFLREPVGNRVTIARSTVAHVIGC